MYKKIVVFIMLITILSGCSTRDVRNKNNLVQESPTVTESPQSMNEGNDLMEDEDNILFGYNSDSNDMTTFTYTGEVIKIPFHLKAEKKTGHDIGFYVFIDGQVQQYSIEYEDGSKTNEAIMQRIELEEEDMNFQFVVNPDVGKKGEKLGLYICSIIYPSFLPESQEEPSYQYYHQLAQVSPQQIKFEQDAKIEASNVFTTKDGLELSEDIVNNIKMFSTGTVEELLQDEIYSKLYKESLDEKCIVSENGKVPLHFRLYGGLEATYKTTIFVNHEPVQVNGKDYILSNLEKNKMSECDVTLDVSKYDKLDTIYAVTVPAETGYLDNFRVNKTDSILLVNDRK